MGSALPRRLFMTSGPPGCSALAVTFDDGPHPEHTPAVLDRLRALGLRATFFVVGERAAAHPELVARIAAEGHELGHHSYSHGAPHLTSARTAVEEARRTAELLERITGRAPRLYRPPHGKLTAGKLLGLWGLRQAVVLWNRDPKDFASGAVEPIRAYFQATSFAAGDILLLHDVHPHVAPVLEVLAARAAASGLRFTTPADWLHG